MTFITFSVCRVTDNGEKERKVQSVDRKTERGIQRSMYWHAHKKSCVCVSVHLSVHPRVHVTDTLAALLTRHTVNKWWERDEMRWKTKGHESQNGGKMDVWKGARAAGATGWRDERRRNRLGVNDGDIGWDVQAGWVISKRSEDWDDKKSTKTKGSNQDDDRWPRGKERWLEKKNAQREKSTQ